MANDIVCWALPSLWTPHSYLSIGHPTITPTLKARRHLLPSQHYAPHHETRPSALCRRSLSPETVSAGDLESWPCWSGLSYVRRSPTKLSWWRWWWQWFGGVSKVLEQHTCKQISGLTLHNLSLPILTQFYRGIHHSIYLAQAASSFRQVTTTTMAMAMPPMLMMMMMTMMMMIMMMMRVGIYITLWKLVTTWKWTATEEDTCLVLKLTSRVELSRNPLAREERCLRSLRPGGPGLDPSLLLCIH